MHFALTQEHQELSKTLRSLLGRHSDSAEVRRAMASGQGYNAELWSVLCEQIGAPALAVPEKYGGAGFSFFETAVVLEELGYALSPSPLFGSAVLGAHALLTCASDDDCKRLLPGVADGSTIAALAWADQAGHWNTASSDVSAREASGWKLTGTATLVMNARAADVLLVVAQSPNGTGLFEVDADASGVTYHTTPAMDPTLDFSSLEFNSAAATPLALKAEQKLASLSSYAVTAITAMQVGAAQRCLDMTVDYVGQRHQFGRAIGSFQAVKHQIADMLVHVETSRSVSWAASWAVAEGAPDASVQSSIAKAWCSDALNATATENVQLHGGIAITWEHDAHLLLKRAHALSQLFGQAHEHRRDVFALRDLAGR